MPTPATAAPDPPICLGDAIAGYECRSAEALGILALAESVANESNFKTEIEGTWHGHAFEALVNALQSMANSGVYLCKEVLAFESVLTQHGAINPDGTINKPTKGGV